MKVAALLSIYLGKAKTTLVAYGKWFETLARLAKQKGDLKTSARPNLAVFNGNHKISPNRPATRPFLYDFANRFVGFTCVNPAKVRLCHLPFM